MVCSNCDQEINDGIKFCTKCGSKINVGKAGNANILSYLTFGLIIIGIIGLIVLSIMIKQHLDNRAETHIWWDIWYNYFNIIKYFRLTSFVSIILAIIVLFKQKNKLVFIAGLVSCGYFVLSTLNEIFLGFLRFYIIRF